MTKPRDLQQVLVQRKALIEELKRLFRILGRRYAGEALFVGDVGRLIIRVGGVECTLPAAGTWAGEARASASLLRAIAKVPPAADPVPIEARDGRLRIGGVSTPCRWQPVGAALIEVPLDLDLRGRLRLAVEHPPEQLEASGLGALVRGARAEMERRILAAAAQLAPLGVSPTDLRTLVITGLGGGR